MVGSHWNLIAERFDALVGELKRWRVDPETQRTKSGQLFSFVKGLRLSAGLIYIVRQLLRQTGSTLEANWGQVLGSSGPVFSPECDVIIHRQGEFARWNGSEDAVMDFRFIESGRAVAVISCKSQLDAIRVDLRTYCASVKHYVDKVLLFAECCRPGAGDRLQDRARAAGYDSLWYLYTWDQERSMVHEEEAVWKDFAEYIRSLALSVPDGGSPE